MPSRRLSSFNSVRAAGTHVSGAAGACASGTGVCTNASAAISAIEAPVISLSGKSHVPARHYLMIRDSGMATFTSATTRAVTRIGSRPRRGIPLVSPGDIVFSAESGLQYRIDRLLGEGGFGQVYLSRRLGRSKDVPPIVCIKVSSRIDGWLREAYFGQLLQEHQRAIRVFDTFPTVRSTGQPLYCLALEYARHGDLSAFLARNATRFSEAATRREIAGILAVLGKLHRGQALHRDLTPLNVFVCDNRTLKLGDFGIVRQQSDERGVTAHTT